MPELTNSINDSADICATLRDLGFDTLCFNDIATLADFKRRLGDFRAKLAPGTAGVFYDAGHGIEIDGENHLIPTSARVRRREDIPVETLSMRNVMDTLEQARTDFNLVVLDACRNSPFAKHLPAHMRQPGLPVESLIKQVSAAMQAETLKTPATSRRPTATALSPHRDFRDVRPGPTPPHRSAPIGPLLAHEREAHVSAPTHTIARMEVTHIPSRSTTQNLRDTTQGFSVGLVAAF